MILKKETLKTVISQSTKLVELSSSLQTWHNGPYNHILKMVNTETLDTLRLYWTKYANYTDPNRKQCSSVLSQSKTIFTVFNKIGASEILNRSFGPRYNDPLAVSIAKQYIERFWKTGTVDKQLDPNSVRDANPLIVYSSTGDDRLAIHHRINPLAGFHLATAIIELTPDSPFYTPHDGTPRSEEKAIDNTLFVAKMQFSAWCSSFQKLSLETNKNPDRLTIRFFVGDAIAFCSGLSNANLKLSYSRPWTARPFRLDGDVPCSPAGSSLSFNVIDTSSLTEDIGFLNLLLSTIPLLEESSSSVLYTETLRSTTAGEEVNILSDLLCHTDVKGMCALFGVVPIPYLTGISTQSKDQGYTLTANERTPTMHRIPWKLAKGIDPKPNDSDCKTACDPKLLATLLYDIYLKMFANESTRYFESMIRRGKENGTVLTPVPFYTRSSYAALLTFLKSRISVDWTKFMRCLLTYIEQDHQLMIGNNSIQDLFLQMHLSGAHSRFPFGQEVEGLYIPGYAPLSRYRHDHGILKYQNPPKTSCLVITVPRHKLQVIFRTCVEQGNRGNIIFQVNVLGKMFHNIFSSVQHVFGKVTPSDDGKNCSIAEDAKGWYGSADLQLCVVVPTYMYLIEDPKGVEVSVRLHSDLTAMMLFRELLSKEMEIFRARLLSTSVHLVRALPGIDAPRPSVITALGEQVMVAKDSTELTYPLLNQVNRHYTIRINIGVTTEKETLKSGEEVDFLHSTPRTVIVTCGTAKWTCTFPFPIDQPVRIRVARKSGWIEVIAPLQNTPTIEWPSFNIMPVIYDPQQGLCNWSAPYIDFRKLPQIQLSSTSAELRPWFLDHLAGMFSDREYELELSNKGGFLSGVKKLTRNILSFTPAHSTAFRDVAIASTPSGPADLILFVKGLCLDSISHSIVAEAYALPVSNVINVRHLATEVQKLNWKSPTVEILTDQFELWTRALMAMAERCRDWEHKESCEWTKEGLQSVGSMKSSFCSCGVGKVGDDFKKSQWREFSGYVTRVAITPIFAVPYLEPARATSAAGNQQNTSYFENPMSNALPRSRVPRGDVGKTRAGGIDFGEAIKDTVQNASKVGAEHKCATCGKEGRKKCSRCEKIYYCSKECQAKDWTKHKAVCKKS
jgi:hypothetical protein